MKTLPTEINGVIYNAASQCFEALVTVHDGRKTRSYPCAIAAPIGMSFEDASKGLARQALRRHGKRYHLSARRIASPAARRPGRPRPWIISLLSLRSQRAA